MSDERDDFIPSVSTACSMQDNPRPSGATSPAIFTVHAIITARSNMAHSLFSRMNHLFSVVLAAALVVSFTHPAIAAPDDGARAQHVVIISFDQGAPREIKAADNMPIFQQMAQQGAADWQAYTIVPSLTLPSHTSMLTGVGIQKHQVDWNDYQPEKGVVKVPTIFSLAHKAGLSTAMFVGKEKFKHLNLPDSLDHFSIDGVALDVAAAFAKDWPDHKYNLTFLHFNDIDAQGHTHAQHSPQWHQALADTDAALKIVRDTIENSGDAASTVIILTADHGGHNITDEGGNVYAMHGSSAPDDVEIPWIAWGANVKPGFNITAPVVTYDTSATALWLLGCPVPESFWGRPVISVFQH